MKMKSNFKYSINTLSEKSIIIQFQQIIDEDLLNFILGLKLKLQDFFKEKHMEYEVFNTYAEVGVLFLNRPPSIQASMENIKTIVDDFLADQSDNDCFSQSSKYRIPVCYSSDFAKDLDNVAQYTNLEKEEVIALHHQPVYRVYFIGFLPGFPYLGGMNEKICVPRKKQARKQIDKGDVGIAGCQTGIYPEQSPGGWQIIGNSPIDLINLREKVDSVFKAGDLLEFYPISPEEHRAILHQEKSINLEVDS